MTTPGPDPVPSLSPELRAGLRALLVRYARKRKAAEGQKHFEFGGTLPSAENCGTGDGGFQPGNTCAAKGEKKEGARPKAETPFRLEGGKAGTREKQGSLLEGKGNPPDKGKAPSPTPTQASAEEKGPETAITGLKYSEGTHDGADGRCSIDLRFADWVNRQTAEQAGLNRKTGVWAGRLEDLGKYLHRADFDRIAGVDPAGNRYGGGTLDRAGVARAVQLAAERKAEKEGGSAPARGGDVECLECGRTYPASQAHRVRAHGMGCDRCSPRH